MKAAETDTRITEVVRPTTSMFVEAARAGDEIVTDADKRYRVLANLAVANGHPRTKIATTLVRRPFCRAVR